MSRLRRGTAVAFRAALVVLLAGALAGAAALRTTRDVAVIFVVDASGSVERYAPPVDVIGEDGALTSQTLAERVRTLIDDAHAAKRPDDRVGVVMFGGNALAIATPTRAAIGDRQMDVRVAQGTDLAGAIRLASSLVPPDAAGRLVLVSDGNETAGDVMIEAERLASRNASRASSLPIDVVPVEYAVKGEVVLESLDLPPTAAADATVTARVLLRSASAATGTLRLSREGEAVDLSPGSPETGRRVALEAGENVVLLPVPLGRGRVHRLEAIFEPDRVVADGGVSGGGDRDLANNRADAFTLTPGEGRVLVLDGVGGGDVAGAGATLGSTLEAAGLRVDLRAPSAMPRSLLELEAYDLVILQDVPADAVGTEGAELLAAHVSELGAGLVMTGGPSSFGAGGWKGSVLEPMLPVELSLPERLISPDAAIAFVLDASGSMGWGVLGSARSKQEIVNEATALAMRTLDPRDLVGVWAFNRAVYEVVPLGPNARPDESAALVAGISPGGGTDAGPGLRRAFESLRTADAKVRHVILLSDGRSMGAESLPEYAELMADAGVRVSTISVGDEADDQTMRAIAERGGGTHYRVINPRVLPRVFVRAVRVVRTPMVREQPFEPVVVQAASPTIAGLGEPPTLRGLTITQPRSEPTITLAMQSDRGEPVLAHWSVGLGRVGAFTSDAHEWAEPWLEGSEYYASFWPQLVRSLARSPGGRGTELRVAREGDRVVVRARIADEDGTPMDGVAADATVYGPDGAERITLVQTGPGEYEGVAAAEDEGLYIAVVSPTRAGEALSPAVGGTSVVATDETRQLESNRVLLERVARETGGRVLELAGTDIESLWDREGVMPREARLPIWPALLAWSLAVFVVDVGTRRVAWDRLLGEKRGARDGEVRAAGARAAASLGSLRSKPIRAESGDAALGQADAVRIASAAAERRRAERLARARARAEAGGEATTSGGPVASPSEAGAASSESRGAAEAPDESASGLLAAKRRARERFEGGDSEV